jgi:hypothetical protein
MGRLTRYTRREQIGAVLTLLVVLTVAGCSSSGGDKPKAGASSQAATPTTGSPAGPTGSAGPVGPTASSVPVIAVQRNLPVPNQNGDTMTVGVRSLTVDPNGTTMTLRLVFTPQFSSKPDQDVTLGDLAPGTYVRPDLLDRAHLKRYDVIAANDKNGFLESASGTGAPNGQSFEAWFVYAAPQDQVSSLEVSVLDSWPPFPSVPVQR